MKNILNKLFAYENLTHEESRVLLHGIGVGEYNDSQLASLMTVFLMRSISTEELTGFADALLEMCHSVDFEEYAPIDIVGTGGDGKNTFNISTCASVVVAASGYKVAKHGNYGATSVSGASNVMEMSGVKFSSDYDTLRRSMDECGLVYLHAPLFNPAMKAVAPVRRNLGVRTFFNILGPLVNPARPKHQLLGVYNLSMLRLYNYVFQSRLSHYAVVHSLDGYDEVSLTSDFKISTPMREKIYSPEELGFKRYCEADLYGGDTPEDAAKIFHSVLDNCSTAPQKDAVIINAAFAISTASNGVVSVESGIEQARESIESGKARETFNKFLKINS
ncbi:MAG: anthranilate phosphoribosyltransferase [Rikenellaceae bacterium]